MNYFFKFPINILVSPENVGVWELHYLAFTIKLGVFHFFSNA